METTQPDLVMCRCNTCDGQLQFERQQSGQRVECPHCGIETLLFVPATAPPVEQSPQANQIQEETVFLKECGITVTKARFIVSHQTYAIANITSVSAIKIPPKRAGVVVFVLFAGLLSLFGFEILRGGVPEARLAGIILLIPGLIMTVAGIFALIARKTSYAVILNTAGSEMKSYVS